LGDDILDDACYFVRHDVSEPVETVDNNLIQSLFRIMDSYLKDYIETEIKKVPNDRIDDLLSMIPQLFFFSAFWSIGTTTTLKGREAFNKFWRQKLKKHAVTFPEEKLVYDWYL